MFYKGFIMSIPLHLQTLQSHYCPEVSRLASQLLESVDKKSEENIGKYLDRDMEEVNPLLSSSISLVPCIISHLQMMLSAATKLSDEQTVPLNFREPSAECLNVISNWTKCKFENERAECAFIGRRWRTTKEQHLRATALLLCWRSERSRKKN